MFGFSSTFLSISTSSYKGPLLESLFLLDESVCPLTCLVLVNLTPNSSPRTSPRMSATTKLPILLPITNPTLYILEVRHF